MRKRLLLILSLLLILPFGVNAEEGTNVKTVVATVNKNTITFNGTTQDDSVAVMCKLLSGATEVDKLSVEVSNSAFTGSFVVEETGSYTVACANYGGGTIVSDDANVSNMQTFTVEFNTNGGSNIDSIVVEYGNTINAPADPVKDDKVFGGWYEDGTFTTPFEFSKHITANTTLYAKWNDSGEEPGDESIRLQVIFFGEGGTYQVDFEADDSINPDPLGEPVNSSHNYFIGSGQQVTLTAIPSDGYSFAGWFVASEEEGETPGMMEWVPGNNLSGMLEYTFTATDSHYNVMPIFEHTVTCANGVGHNNIWNTSGGNVAVLYEAGGFDGTNFTNGHVVDYCNSDEITVKAQADVGYHFIGWYVSNVQQGPEYYYSNKLVSTNTNYTYQPGTTMVVGIDEAINYLTAVFEEDQPGIFTVIFNTAGGSEIASVDVEVGQKVSRPDNDPTRDNKTFAGWYADDTLTTEFNFNTPITQNTTVYAKWVNKVTFNTNGGSAIASVTVEDDGRVAKPNDPTKDGFVFDGWFEDPELEHEYNFDNPINQNITIYAKWGKLYNIEDEDENEVSFVDEPNQDLHLVVTDLESLSDDELLLLDPQMDRETFDGIVKSLTDAAKQYGTLLSFLDISVLNNNDDAVDIGEVIVKLGLTNEMKGYKSYKLIYIDTDNNGNIVLGSVYDLELKDGKLVTKLPHLSAYVLVGSNEEATTDGGTATQSTTNTTSTKSPKTFDNIMIWFIVAIGSLIGLSILTVKKLRK